MLVRKDPAPNRATHHPNERPVRMPSISEFALHLLDELSQRFNDTDRWNFVISSLNQFGFNALNLASFSPETGVINWARSSMSPQWLQEYSDGNFAEADPILAQVSNGIDSLYVDAVGRSLVANEQRSSELYRGLERAGYNHLFSLAVPCANDEAKMVVLSSNMPGAEQMMTDQAREMRILATVIATNLGSETGALPPGIHDLAPGLASAPPLSQREKQVLQYLAEGMRNDRIAEQLDLSEVTVRAHIRTARDKLGAPTREAALVRAVQMGMLDTTYYRKR